MNLSIPIFKSNLDSFLFPALINLSPAKNITGTVHLVSYVETAAKNARKIKKKMPTPM